MLELARRVLLVDPAYVARIKRHYALFRSKVDGRGKKSPQKRAEENPQEMMPTFAASKTSLNDPESDPDLDAIRSDKRFAEVLAALPPRASSR